MIRDTVRKLRKNQTDSEKIFWKAVRNRNLNGLKFYRQYPIEFYVNHSKHFYVADFCCFEKNLVIELDGPYHKFQKEYDKNREHVISQQGFRILRFTNKEVTTNLKSVLEKVLKVTKESKLNI